MSTLPGQGQIAKEAKQSAPLDVIFNKISTHNSRLAEMLGALTNVMDNMVGVIPAEVTDTAAEPTASTSIAKINGALGDQKRLVNQLAEQIQRVAELG